MGVSATHTVQRQSSMPCYAQVCPLIGDRLTQWRTFGVELDTNTKHSTSCWRRGQQMRLPPWILNWKMEEHFSGDFGAVAFSLEINANLPSNLLCRGLIGLLREVG